MKRSALVTSFSVSLFVLALCSFAWSPTEEPPLVVAESGSEPLKALRYELPEDGEWLLFVDRDLKTEIAWGGKPMNLGVSPGCRFRMSVLNAQAPEGVAVSLELSNMSVELIPTKDTKPEMVKALESYWAPLSEVKITLHLSHHGVLQSTVLMTPEDMSPFLQDDLGILVQNITSLVIPFPTEPIGAGAVWTAEKPSKHLQFEGKQASRVSLDSQSGEVIELSVHTKREFQRQSVKPVHNPDLETLHYLKSSEDKTSRIDLRQPFPLFTHAEGTNGKEVDNLLGMLAKTENAWTIEAGLVPTQGGAETWANLSQLFPAVESTPEED